ncbi:MAG TPA: alpha/beta fold hydrolase [Methylomirabilota bacterium]|nr:alpha/beta fold hydrolase [Methylomirabilota bacterium]
MSRVVAAAVLAAALLSSPATVRAHGPNQPPHQQYRIGDLALESGETIKDFTISYVTHGTLNAQKSNAILMVTAISGNHHRLDFLIGPGKALDPRKYFIVATDAIGNGLTSSPSNSQAQPRMAFPRFLIRDMVTSQRKLLEHLGISHVVAVVGPSMGGMQTLQWGVSHPDFMDSLVAMVPLARTPAWTVVVLDASRKAIMLDPAWNGGNYTAPPVNGVRLWRDILGFLAARTPDMYRDQFPEHPLDVLPWLKAQEDAQIPLFDANDWIYQTWAYDAHDVGTTPGMNGDYVKALRAIKAKTLILAGQKDLLNPEWEPLEASRYIRDVRYVTITPRTITGHASAGGIFPADVDFLNSETGAFLDLVTRAHAH